MSAFSYAQDPAAGRYTHPGGYNHPGAMGAPPMGNPPMGNPNDFAAPAPQYNPQYGMPPNAAPMAGYGNPQSVPMQPGFVPSNPMQSMAAAMATQYMQNMSPDMLQNAGQSLLKNSNTWTGLSSFFLSLKPYFSVNNPYVIEKCKIIGYPIAHRNWERIPAENYSTGEATTHKFALPYQDVNAPDLYIPVMSFITYVLLSCLSRSLISTDFTPDSIIQTVSRCLFLEGVEASVIKVGTNMISSSVPFLDIIAYSSYKYVPLVVTLLASLLHGSLRYLFGLYGALMLAYFTLKAFAKVVPESSNAVHGSSDGFSQRMLVLLLFAGVQLLLVLFMAWF